jgi:hypothetical protein
MRENERKRDQEVRQKKKDGQSHLVVHVCANTPVVHDLKLSSANFVQQSGWAYKKNSQENQNQWNEIGEKQH